MLNISLVYGGIAGVIIIAAMIVGYAVSGGEGFGSSQAVGFLFMFIALSLIFIGVKKYRDQEMGGVIKFGKALLVGLSISLVAAIAYIISWEIYLAVTDYAFAEQYVEMVIAQWEAKGISGAELAEKTEMLNRSMANYDNPFYRIPITFTEIFPVALVISLVSAAILRNPKVLPARG